MGLLDRRFLMVIGKGGVGKTTVSTALALAAAREGKRVLLCMVNAKERVSQLLHLEEPIETEIVNVADGIDAVNMTPAAALEEYGLMILKVRAVYRAVFENRLVRAFLRGTPGLESWSMLGKAHYHAHPPNGKPEYDLVLLDAPATGHALDMLRVPLVIQKVAPPGLLRREAVRALELFRDEKRAGAVLVTLGEDMPVNETLELYDALTNELEIPVLRLVVNRLLEQLFQKEQRELIRELPEQLAPGSAIQSLAIAGRRRVLKEIMQDESVARLAEAIPAERIDLPYCFGLEQDVALVQELSRAFDDPAVDG